jgi:L-lactate utilization protein LutB
MLDPMKKRNSLLGPQVVKALKERFFEAWYVETAAAAVEKALELIPQGDVVSWGGALSVDSIGLKDAVKRRGNPVIDRDSAKSPEERVKLMREALLCDTFLASSNAISEDGELVNIDGNGNRVAAMIFGPKQVIVIAGMNKVVHSISDACERARTIAAPANAQRFGGKTPCTVTGACAHCKSADSVCSFIVRTRLCKPAGRIKVILVGEDLGL